MFATSLIIGMLMLAVPFAAVVALIIWLVQRRKEFFRKRAYEAAQCGWYPAPPNPWLVEAAANLWKRGRPGQMIAGDFRGRGMCALDYTYETTTSGANGETTTTTHQVHLVALSLPVALPPLTVTADSKLRRFIGGRDLELESQAFNDAFRISCADDRYASAVIHPRMMEWLLFNPGLEWQFSGNALISWGTGPFLVHDTLARLEAMAGVVDRIPPFVLRDYGQVTY